MINDGSCRICQPHQVISHCPVPSNFLASCFICSWNQTKRVAQFPSSVIFAKTEKMQTFAEGANKDDIRVDIISIALQEGCHKWWRMFHIIYSACKILMAHLFDENRQPQSQISRTA